jgi:flagellar biosynthesis protein FlhF
MRIKKYFAKNMRDALTQIKEDLGEDAVILKTRKLQKNLFAMGEKNEVEVTAAVDDTSEDQKNVQVMPLNLIPKKDEVQGVYGRPRSSCIVDMDKPDAPVVKKWVPPEYKSLQNGKKNQDETGNGTKMEDLKENLEELRELVKSVIDNKTENGTVQKYGNSKLLNQLIESEVKSELAHSIVNKINGHAECGDKKLIIKKLTDIFSEEFPVSGPLRLKKGGPLIVAFVGPTGSGKTTTIAKLAAHCAINKNKRVSIIAADTYRIAAIEQIKIFADIVKVHIEVVFSPDEVPDALNSCRNSDIILVDTAGRSQKNDQHLHELKELMDVLNPDEIHLVLGATTKYSDLKNTIEKFSIVKISRLLFTKIDETLRLGNVFSVANDFKIPVSYLTFGQSVPDDIEPAHCTRIVENLMEGIVL